MDVHDQVLTQWRGAYDSVVTNGVFTLEEWTESDYLWMSPETYGALKEHFPSLYSYYPPCLFDFQIKLDDRIPLGRLEWIVKGAYPDTLEQDASVE